MLPATPSADDVEVVPSETVPPQSNPAKAEPEHDERGQDDERVIEARPADIVHNVDHPEDVERSPIIVPPLEDLAI